MTLNEVKVLGALGLVASMIGILLIYLNSPLNEFGIDGGNAATDFDAIEATQQRKNRGMKFGTALVLAGSALQLASTLIA